MIKINIFAYINKKWVEQDNFTRPVSGSDKLDETLDSAIADFTLQAEENKLPPFTKIKIVVQDEQDTKTYYFVVGTPSGEQARMGE